MEIEKQNFHWIFEAQFVRKGEENFYQSGAFKELFKGICSFFAFIRSVLFEKNLSSGLECNFCQQHGVSCEPVMQRNGKTYFRTKLRINKEDEFFLPSALKVLSRETSPDPKRCGSSGKAACFTMDR